MALMRGRKRKKKEGKRGKNRHIDERKQGFPISLGGRMKEKG